MKFDIKLKITPDTTPDPLKNGAFERSENG
jgi:hypothetical protein